MALSVIGNVSPKPCGARPLCVGEDRGALGGTLQGKARQMTDRPRGLPYATSNRRVHSERIVTLRRQRWTGRQIAHGVGISPATVRRVLTRTRRRG